MHRLVWAALEWVLVTTGPLNTHRIRSNMVGVSCIFIGVPGLWYAHKGQPLLGLNGAQMGLCSFFSDFVLASPDDFSQTARRRAFALDLWSIYFYVGTLLINVSMYAKLETSLPLLMGLLVAKVAVLDWSAASSSRSEWKLRHSVWHGVVVLLAFAAHGAIWTSMNFPDHHGFQLLYDFVSLPNEEVAPVGGFVLVMVMVALALTAAADAFLSTKKGTTRTRTRTRTRTTTTRRTTTTTRESRDTRSRSRSRSGSRSRSRSRPRASPKRTTPAARAADDSPAFATRSTARRTPRRRIGL